MIRLGIVGSNFGRAVLLPAMRADPRCRVAAIAGSDPAKAAAIARAEDIAEACADWRAIADHPQLDAVAVAVPPRLQPEIAVRALRAGKAVFVEKPLAADIASARAMLEAAQAAGRPVMVDFEFCELPAWRQAKALIDGGALGALRHVAVDWQTENAATRLRLQSWKTSAAEGGGVLGNFVSHCFHYLEYFCGPLRDLSARLFDLPGEARPLESAAALAGTFRSGAAFMLSMSAAAYLGCGHRIAFHGEDGTLVLRNPTADYMRGFELLHARRPAAALTRFDCSEPEPDLHPDGRIAPVTRLAKRWFDAIESGLPAVPGLRQGYRVQELIAAARASHASGGCRVTLQDEAG